MSERATETDAPAPARIIWHVVLFVATFFTTTATGALWVHPDSVRPISDGLSYSLPLLLILVCHEAGHYFAAKLHGEPASLPYFIPLPPAVGLFGTMGAVIRMRSMTTDRRKLIDIGAAGPLVGLAVAIPVLFYGLTLSEVKPIAGAGLQEGNSLLYAALKYLAKGAWLPGGGRDVMLHPTAWAGWAGLLITMINLFPVGQLDGGHVAAAYLGPRFARASRTVHRLLPLLAVIVFASVYTSLVREVAGRPLPHGLSVFDIALQPGTTWLTLYVLLWLVRRMMRGQEHPPTDDRPLPRSRVLLFWMVALAFVLIFMPVPLRISVGFPITAPAVVAP